MKKLFRPYLTAFLLGSLLFSFTSCDDDDDPDPIEEEEQITQMTVTLVPDGKGNTVTATYSDPDGDGGNAPTIQTMNLAPNTVYTAKITLADGSTDITEEIRNEGTDHEFFYSFTPENLMTVQKQDRDSNNRLLGMEALITTGGAQTGTLTILLKHQPGLKGVTSDTSKGETYVEAAFPVTIQ